MMLFVMLAIVRVSLNSAPISRRVFGIKLPQRIKLVSLALFVVMTAVGCASNRDLNRRSIFLGVAFLAA